MPYIRQLVRETIDPYIQPLAEKLLTAGDLNYAITRLIGAYLLDKGVNYFEINTVAGVLQKVAAEFDARVTRPYEEVKIAENGDVPEYRKINNIIVEDHTLHG